MGTVLVNVQNHQIVTRSILIYGKKQDGSLRRELINTSTVASLALATKFNVSCMAGALPYPGAMPTRTRTPTTFIDPSAAANKSHARLSGRGAQQTQVGVASAATARFCCSW